ncbi:MAG: hypothetical protein ACRC67_28550 [Inquilinus sp.]|uniref:hypothetical protein n=1 Tax=Inquilinus sp. TaxID=1932117 RepID=UPI003F31835B
MISAIFLAFHLIIGTESGDGPNGVLEELHSVCRHGFERMAEVSRGAVIADTIERNVLLSDGGSSCEFIVHPGYTKYGNPYTLDSRYLIGCGVPFDWIDADIGSSSYRLPRENWRSAGVVCDSTVYCVNMCGSLIELRHHDMTIIRPCMNSEISVDSRRSAIIGYFYNCWKQYTNHGYVLWRAYDRYSEVEPRSAVIYEIALSDPVSFHRLFNRLVCGGGGFSRFINGAVGSICGPARMNEGAPNQKDAEKTESDLSGGSPKHRHSPESHILLGGKIALSAVAFFGGFWLIFLGFHRAGDATEKVLDGRRVFWLLAIWWDGAALFGAGLSSGVITYWLGVGHSSGAL